MIRIDKSLRVIKIIDKESEARMHSQHQETKNPSDRPSFFGRPAAWRDWSQAGPRFWIGMLAGFGLGLAVAAALVETELLTLHRKAWVSVTGIVLFSLGVGIGRPWGALGRQRKQDQGQGS